MIEYNNFIIKTEEHYTKNGVLFDITYTVYFKNGEFFTNYLSHTLEQVKKDLLHYN